MGRSFTMATEPTFTYTTGILTKHSRTNCSRVSIVNLDEFEKRNVMIEILNWTVCPPAPLGLQVFLNGTELSRGHSKFAFELEPNEYVEICSQGLSGVAQYEVRITLQIEKNVVFNSWGEASSDLGQADLQVGNTVLNNQFVRLDS
jgi:hypothetical protein